MSDYDFVCSSILRGGYSDRANHRVIPLITKKALPPFYYEKVL